MNIVKAMMRTECPRQTFASCRGGSGERGMLQWMPNQFGAVSRQVTGETLAFTEVNEMYVGALKVQMLLDEGKGGDAREIGMIWNTSLMGAEKPLEKVGVNRFGVEFNSIIHGLRVKRAYAQVVSEK